VKPREEQPIFVGKIYYIVSDFILISYVSLDDI
jgi:hypothetical protein